LQLQQKIQFSERLNNVALWVSKAKELIFSADCLKPEIKSQWGKVAIQNDEVVNGSKNPWIQGIYFMLIAYAIENLCKVILIHRKKEEWKNRLLSKVPKDIKGHDLLKLTKDIKMHLNISEQKLLARVTRNSIWDARYPLPLEADHMRTSEKLLNGQNSFSAYLGPNDISEIENFLKRLRKLVKDELNIDI